MSKKQEFVPVRWDAFIDPKEIRITTSVVLEEGDNLQNIFSKIPAYIDFKEMIFKVEHGYYDDVDYILEYTDYEYRNKCF